MKRASPLLAAALSGAVLALALPLVVPAVSLRPIDPAGRLELVAWIALVPALAALERARSGGRAFGLGLLAGAVYFFAAIHWVSHAMTAFGGLSLPFSLFALSLLVLFMAAHWGLAFAISWTLRARLGWPLWRHLPLVWAASELLRNHLFTGFPWADVGYTQAHHLPVAQLASLVGVYGIAALVVLVNCVLLEAWKAWRARGPAPVRLLGGTAALLAAAIGWGELHLAGVRARAAAAPTIRVGLVQPNVDQAVKNDARDNARWILGRLVPLTEEADRAGADLVAWPEAAYPLYVPPAIASFDRPGAGLPRLSHAHLLLGASTLEWLPGPDGRRVPRLENSDFMVSPGLAVLGRYTKHHLVPFGEYVPLQRWLPFLGKVVPSLASATSGSRLTVLSFDRAARPLSPAGGALDAGAGPAPGGRPPGDAAPPRLASDAPSAALPAPVRIAPMICFDAIFPEINVAFARERPEPELLANPTNDAWYGYSSGPYQFLDIVRMRAIEAGKAVIRPAYAGVTAVILPTGELAPGALDVGPVDPDLAPDPDEPPRLLLADVPLLRGRTVYTTTGDAFAWASAAFAAGALAVAWRRARAGSAAAAPRA